MPGLSGRRSSILLLALLCLGGTLGCRRTPRLYSEALVRQETFGEIFDEASVAVVAVSRGKRPLGPPGLIARPAGLSPFPAQRYLFDLDVGAALRGTVAAGSRVSVVGYEEEGLLTGPPTGVCGPKGSLGIYFLRVVGGRYRTMVDEYRTWIPLDPGVDLSLIAPNDIPLTVWRLLVYPYAAGLRPATGINFPEIYVETGFRLGRLRTIELLSDLADRSPNQGLRVAACSELNQDDRGFGLEGCIRRMLDDPAARLGTQQKDYLTWELDHVPESNARVKQVLLSGTNQRFIEGLANTKDPEEIRGLLEILAKHTDPEIRHLAALRLTQWAPGSR